MIWSRLKTVVCFYVAIAALSDCLIPSRLLSDIMVGQSVGGGGGGRLGDCDGVQLHSYTAALPAAPAPEKPGPMNAARPAGRAPPSREAQPAGKARPGVRFFSTKSPIQIFGVSAECGC